MLIPLRPLTLSICFTDPCCPARAPPMHCRTRRPCSARCRDALILTTGRLLLPSAVLEFPRDVTNLQETRQEMKRRDLLKTAGTMMLAAPAVRASALVQ